MPVDLDFDEDTAYAWYEHGSVGELHTYHKGMLCTRKPVLGEELSDELGEDGPTTPSDDDGAIEYALADIHSIM